MNFQPLFILLHYLLQSPSISPSPPPIMSTHKTSLRGVLSETSRIISVNSHHFLAISVILIFPISLASTVYSLLFQPASLQSHYHQFLSNVSTPVSETPPAGKFQPLMQIIYILFALILNLSAATSITYSTFNGFYSRPANFAASLKSIIISFFPLLATKLVTMIILGLVVLGLGLLMMLPVTGLVLLGFNMDYNSIYFIVCVVLFTIVLIGVLAYLGIQWHLTTAIVVLESQWGFAPLKRSSYLVKGVQGVIFLMMLLFGVLSGILSIWYSNLKANYAGNINKGCAGWVVVQIVVYAGFSTVLSLYSLVADAVLFVYCKELHGESKFQIDEKNSEGYVRLPFNDV